MLEVDNHGVRENQIRRLNELKASRNTKEVQEALGQLTDCASSGQGNLLEFAIKISFQYYITI